MTEWRPVLGFEGLYEVSDDGQVANVRRSRRPLRRFVDASGYYRLGLRRGDGHRYNRRVHTLVAEAFHGARPAGMVARHLDGNSLNNVPSNLAWGTHQQNIDDMLAHGTQRNARKSECKHGHPFDDENTYIEPANGSRHCRTCNARRESERRASRKVPA